MESFNWSSLIPVAITAGVALMIGLLTQWRLRRIDFSMIAKNLTDAAETSNELLRAPVQDLVDRVTALEAALEEKENEVLRLNKEINFLLRWINVLVEQVRDHGGEPASRDRISWLDGHVDDK